MKNITSTGVKKGHFGVTKGEIDSQVLSQEKRRNFTGVNLMGIGVRGDLTGVKNNKIGVTK